jgi:hypothetical protein
MFVHMGFQVDDLICFTHMLLNLQLSGPFMLVSAKSFFIFILAKQNPFKKKKKKKNSSVLRHL